MLRVLPLILFVLVAAAVMVPAQDGGFTRSDLVGTWQTGGMSLMADRNTVTGSTTPSNGHTFKYVFGTDGRFAFTGYLQSTLYGCTTDLFNDKQGRYELNGSQLTLRLTKNYWKNRYSCSPSSNKTRNYVLDPETYDVSTKTDEYGKLFVCLRSTTGEICYRKEKE